jgi:hypothetical protein
LARTKTLGTQREGKKMKLKFRNKSQDEIEALDAEGAYRRLVHLQLRERLFEKQYFDVAAKLEMRRNPKEYIK